MNRPQPRGAQPGGARGPSCCGAAPSAAIRGCAQRRSQPLLSTPISCLATASTPDLELADCCFDYPSSCYIKHDLESDGVKNAGGNPLEVSRVTNVTVNKYPTVNYTIHAAKHNLCCKKISEGKHCKHL